MLCKNKRTRVKQLRAVLPMSCGPAVCQCCTTTATVVFCRLFSEYQWFVVCCPYRSLLFMWKKVCVWNCISSTVPTSTNSSFSMGILRHKLAHNIRLPQIYLVRIFFGNNWKFPKNQGIVENIQQIRFDNTSSIAFIKIAQPIRIAFLHSGLQPIKYLSIFSRMNNFERLKKSFICFLILKIHLRD